MKLHNVDWIPIDKQKMPLEQFILVSHKYGVDYISFNSAAWRYCYSGTEVDSATLKNITHWCKPIKSQNI